MTTPANVAGFLGTDNGFNRMGFGTQSAGIAFELGQAPLYAPFTINQGFLLTAVMLIFVSRAGSSNTQTKQLFRLGLSVVAPVAGQNPVFYTDSAGVTAVTTTTSPDLPVTATALDGDTPSRFASASGVPGVYVPAGTYYLCVSADPAFPNVLDALESRGPGTAALDGVVTSYGTWFSTSTPGAYSNSGYFPEFALYGANSAPPAPLTTTDGPFQPSTGAQVRGMSSQVQFE